MKPLQTLIVAKAIAEKTLKEARPKLAPQRCEVDLTVRIHGTIEIGDDYEQRLTRAVPWEHLAKMAFDRLNAESRALIVRSVQEAQAEGTLPELLDEIDSVAKDEVYNLFETLKESTVRRCNGKVTPHLAVEALTR